MHNKNQLTISEFSKLTGIKRDNLRFYDRIGLLTPEKRGDNNYRYYSRHQLNTAFLITGLRGVGIGIEEIKEYAMIRSPKESLSLFSKHDKRIQEEIAQLHETREIMRMHYELIVESLSHEEDALLLRQQEKEPIYLCPAIPAGMDSDEGGIFSYANAEEAGVNLGFPMGIKVLSTDIEERLRTGNGQFFFKDEKHCNAYKPAGLYAVAYGRGDPWDGSEVYHRLQNYLVEQKLQMCGDIYEEYPICDLSVHAIEHYAIRLEVQVEKIK